MFLVSKAFFFLSSLSLYILQSTATIVALLYYSFSLTTLAFYTTATSVAVHLSGDPTSFPIFGLRRAKLQLAVFLLNFGKPSFPIPIMYFHCLEFGLVA